VYGFAVDDTVNRCFRSTSTISDLNAIHEIEKCPSTINNWMTENKVEQNTPKTEFVMFDS
jgi:hypothetical protein